MASTEAVNPQPLVGCEKWLDRELTSLSDIRHQKAVEMTICVRSGPNHREKDGSSGLPGNHLSTVFRLNST